MSIGRSNHQRIVTGARRCFFANGLRGVSMDDLARELGMSKRTLYAHFPSKSALVEAVLQEKMREVEADLERISSDSAADFPGAFRELFVCVLRHTREVQVPFQRDIMREAPEVFRLIETRRRAMLQRHMGKLFSEGAKAGILRNDIPGELLIEIFLGVVQAIMNPAKLSELGLTVKTGFAAILSVMLEGTVTEEGRARLWHNRE